MTRAPSLAAQRFTLSDLCLACAEDETAPDRHKSVGEALSEMEACHAAVELASSSESELRSLAQGKLLELREKEGTVV